MWARTVGTVGTAGTIVALLALSASAARAQMSGGLLPLSFGIAGGTAIPSGKLGDIANSGYDLTGMLEFKPPVIPFGLRLDASYNQFGYNHSTSAHGHAHVASLTGNVVLSSSFPIVHPYLIGGLGYYNVSAASTQSSDNLGFDIGGGVSVSIPLTGVSVFAEARYNYVGTSRASTQFTPVVLGVTF